MGQVRSLGMDLGEAGAADADVVVCVDQRGQLGGVAQAAGVRLPVGLAPGRVAAQGEDVLDPGLRMSAMTSASSSRVAPTQLRWAIASIPSSCLIHLVSSSVRPRDVPPAP